MRTTYDTEFVIRLGDKLLAAVDAKAARLGISRAELISMLLDDLLAGEMP